MSWRDTATGSISLHARAVSARLCCSPPLSLSSVNGLKMFHGLAIEKLWQDRGTYKVLHLDFSMTLSDSPESFEKSAETMFLRAAEDCGLIERSSLQHDFSGLADAVDAVCRKSQDTSLVLLIDEYDSPLSANLNNPDVFESITSRMRSFLRL